MFYVFAEIIYILLPKPTSIPPEMGKSIPVTYVPPVAKNKHASPVSLGSPILCNIWKKK